jgi:exonuclease-1
LIALRREKKTVIPDGYEDGLFRAELTFLHQRVFDPVSKTVIHLSPLSSNMTSEDLSSFLGPDIPPDIGYQISIGKLDPYSHEPFELPESSSSSSSTSSASVQPPWLRRGSNNKTPLPTQKNTISSYFRKSSVFSTSQFLYLHFLIAFFSFFLPNNLITPQPLS